MSALVNNTSTTSKRSCWPEKAHELWAIEAGGCRVQLSNLIWYDDWAMALGAVTTSYNHFRGRFKPCTSVPWKLEGTFAERFCEAMGTEAVRFFKSGSDAVSCAVRLARAYTGRKYVIVFDQCYHGTGDWHGENLWTKAGIVDTDHLVVKSYGELVRSECWDIWPVAAIVLEPVPKSVLLPPEGWLQHLREVCDEHGILLISDEIILGFRHTLRGYLDSVDIRPDLACYGKAMGQGAALSACTGRREVLDYLVDKVHFSGTNNGEWLPLAIASMTLAHYQQEKVCEQLTEAGFYLRRQLELAGFEVRGLHERFEVVLGDEKMAAVEYCFDNGILWPGFCSMATGHTKGQADRLVNILRRWRESK